MRSHAPATAARLALTSTSLTATEAESILVERTAARVVSASPPWSWMRSATRPSRIASLEGLSFPWPTRMPPRLFVLSESQSLNAASRASRLMKVFSYRQHAQEQVSADLIFLDQYVRVRHPPPLVRFSRRQQFVDGDLADKSAVDHDRDYLTGLLEPGRLVASRSRVRVNFDLLVDKVDDPVDCDAAGGVNLATSC